MNSRLGHVCGPYSDRPTRRLAAILVADVAGYSRLIDRDERRTHARLRALQAEVIEPSIAMHAGRVVRLAGDSMLVIFSSATAALLCAVETQREIAERSKSVPECERLRFRVGINVADILIDEREIAGSGVNLAARLEALADPGGICVSRALKEQIQEDIGVEYLDAGLRRVKNISRPVRVFHVVCGPKPILARMRASLGRFAFSPFVPLIASAAMVLVVSALALTQLPSARSEVKVIKVLAPAADANGGSSDLRIEISIAPDHERDRAFISPADRGSRTAESLGGPLMAGHEGRPHGAVRSRDEARTGVQIVIQ